MDSGSQGQGAETGVPPQDPSFPCLAAQRSTHKRGHQGLECGTCNLILGRLSGARLTTPRCYKGRPFLTGLPQFHRLETKEEPVKRDDTLVAPIRGCSRLAQRFFRINITTRLLVLTSGVSGVTGELSCSTQGGVYLRHAGLGRALAVRQHIRQGHS